MSTNATAIPYCDLKEFGKLFHFYYTYIGLFVCVFGSVTNILNIIVLTSRDMRCATNTILTGLAFADLLVMIENIPFIWLSSVNRNRASHFTYVYAIYVMAHALFTQAFHFVACCLTVILAIWRYVAVRFPHNLARWCGERRTRLTLLLAYLLCPAVCLPLYLSLYVVERSQPVVNETCDVFSLNATETNRTVFLLNYRRGVLQLISYYVYGVVIKLVPCILLSLLSALLILELIKAKERRKKLLAAPLVPVQELADKRKCSQKHIEREKQADRTTRMLLVVLLLFLMVEFPQAIFGLLNHVIGHDFEMQCYQPLGELMDVFTLINSAINFVLYCTMSKKFRTVFGKAFLAPLVCLGRPKENWTSLQTLKTYV